MNLVVTKLLESKTQIEAIKPIEKKNVIFLIHKESPSLPFQISLKPAKGAFTHKNLEMFSTVSASGY